MRGFDALEQELDAIKNEGLSIAPEVERSVQNYQRQAEEIEQSLLDQQASDRQSKAKQETSIKRK